MSRKTSPHVALAALAVDLTAAGPATEGSAAPPAEFRLLPIGRFKSADGSGRPAGLPEGWRLDAAAAARIAAQSAGRISRRVIDFEHQTLRSAENGKPAPAAGWLGRLEARADGLYAVDVEWTAPAAAMIAAKQYRYVSPVFPYDKRSGEVLGIAHAALTNDPGLDGLTDLAACSRLAAQFSTAEEESSMKELLKALGLAETATEAEALAALAALKTGQETALAALKSAAPDPAQFVPMTQHAEVQNALAALTAQMEAAERDGLMTAALADGRILPAQDAYWRAQPIAALKSYLEVAQPVAALAGTQTGGKKPAGAGGGGGQLSEAALAVCRQLGVTPEDFAATASAEAV